MVFSSLTFLFLFLPVVLGLYYAVPRALKNGVLFVFSLVFYAWGEPIYVCLMLFSTAVDYCCGMAVEKRRGTPGAKLWLLLSVCVNLALLGLFKYGGFLIESVNGLFGAGITPLDLPLPIGISFYTFQTMSYTIDVYRGEARVQRNIVSFGVYVSLFPQLIAGPIVRYRTIAYQLNNREHGIDGFGDGAKRFALGLGKKVLLANNIGLLWDAVSGSDIGQLSALGAWLGLAAFALQVYFDFSGYSDMAIGLGRMFGFDFLENFNYPYAARSITEFWRRWHISLGTWFRDYVYIPLGGNRGSLALQLRNVAIVWLLTGLWHGASWNYLLWGAYYGVLLIVEKLFLLRLLERAPSFVRRLYTLSLVMLSWVLFAFEDMAQGAVFLRAMFGGCAGFADSAALYQLLSYLPLFLICVAAATPLFSKLRARLEAKCSHVAMCVGDAAAVAVVMVFSVAYLISGSYNPFLYFRF
ncbi:MAG: MBOAT family O-acyltransferase [Clostridia bacterium]|nr:MBOAT family O-acyltransferase [Clostridia bacterium]